MRAAAIAEPYRGELTTVDAPVPGGGSPQLGRKIQIQPGPATGVNARTERNPSS
ncbi:hypothetical protein OG775_35855 [Streptomyces platensis]|uniref:hypothetical protein n=1 Tax=Streptomyces platensis TaxID=58346 RepID=UPI0022516304|nr:hypothetical protein [Streptomyces platensis]MCX4640416.1 hypothetical protein [Streptomyces platensis]